MRLLCINSCAGIIVVVVMVVVVGPGEAAMNEREEILAFHRIDIQ